MGRFILRRLGQGFLVVLGVSLVVFVAMRVFGDPAKVMLPLSATTEQRAEFEHLIGLDRPLPEQFVTFIGELATLDFGDSLWQRRPAMEVVFERLPNTLMLVGAGLGFAMIMALPLGALAALRPGGIIDRVTVIGGLVGLSTPQFWLGLLLIMLFAVQLRILPTSGIGGVSHLILPALTLALPSMARMVLLVRSQVIDELNQQYVKTARAKGLRFHQVLFGHALRNVMIPFITLA